MGRSPRSTLFPYTTLFRSVPTSASMAASIMATAMAAVAMRVANGGADRKRTRLKSRHLGNSYSVFFFDGWDGHRDLHSFPTRRSSDLSPRRLLWRRQLWLRLWRPWL